MEEGEQQVSKYSSGVNILIRIDQLWKDSHRHSRRGAYKDWNSDLDRIWLELARDIKEEDFSDTTTKEGENIKGHNSNFNDFDKKLKEIGEFFDEGGVGFDGLTEKQKGNREEHYKILVAKQLFLARLENTYGKGTTFAEGDEDDYD